MAEGTVHVEAVGHEIAATSPGKVFFGERCETKLDLVRCYQGVEQPLLRAMQPPGSPRAIRTGPAAAAGQTDRRKPMRRRALSERLLADILGLSWVVAPRPRFGSVELAEPFSTYE